ncbi:MAG TPA: 30S ribosomal protein S8 [Candidatus Babeliales bacterium]|nr:30S ribosomal protein S8 [Candidatus Babeliales bacterium]
MASKPSAVAPDSRMRRDIASILQLEGFINGVQIKEVDNRKFISIDLRYVDGESVIHEIKRVSRPGRRSYARMHELKPVIGGLGISILTTNKGLMTNKQAKDLVVGGEVLCTVW